MFWPTFKVLQLEHVPISIFKVIIFCNLMTSNHISLDSVNLLELVTVLEDPEFFVSSSQVNYRLMQLIVETSFSLSCIWMCLLCKKTFSGLCHLFLIVLKVWAWLFSMYFIGFCYSCA